ncbi:BTAD domain-containing putative transcriptional regulator [Actinocrispum sp. NPDC049592]|uniref:BTAD domain-containing putative transcriptional regulator n=1 Tax=Actinocrispum sp. NPDC049592 TaxID=3154835 RepID=UPI003432D5C6
MSPQASAALRVELLGPLRAWRNSAEITLGPPRQRAVFAVLAARAGRSITRAELIAAVWGDHRPASVEGNLHTYISGLRRALDPARSGRSTVSLLMSDNTGYAVRVDPSTLDTLVFERFCEDAVKSASQGDHTAVVEALDAALALWHGDALSGVPGPWAEAERERLAHARLTAIEWRAAAMLALGEHRELCAELASLVREHPVRESFRELLMLALYRSGRHADALEVFREARVALIEELGVEPGEPLRRLHEQVLAFDPALDLVDTAEAPAEPEQQEPEAAALVSVVPVHAQRAVEQDAAGLFVGRAAEVEQLRDLVTDVVDGRGRVVWIEGEPGIGKTDLLAVALADASARGCQVGWGTCHEMSSRVPLQVLKDCLGIAPNAADPRRAVLATELAGPEPAGWAWAQTDPILAAVDNLLALVDELCVRAPLVLVVDDLQWADNVSLQVWRRLTAATRQLPLLLVAACRPVADHNELERLRHRADVGDGVFIPLRPLPATDTKTLVRAMVGTEPGPRLRSLVARAAGNPFYVREIVQALVEGQAIRPVNGGCDVDDTIDFVAPESLVDAVDGRLECLSPGTRDVLSCAALLGIRFAVADVATVMDQRPVDLFPAFEEAVAANVLIEADEYMVFRHSLVHQVFYERLADTDKDKLHLQAAKAMADAGAPVQRVAEQLSAAPSATAPWVIEWLSTHHSALSNRAPLIAVDLLERAVERVDRDDPHREVLIAGLVTVLFRLERKPEALARQALEEVTDPVRAAAVREMLAAMLFRKGRQRAAIDVIERWSEDPGVPEIWRIRHKQLLANFRRGGLDDLEAMERNALTALADTDGDPYLTAHALQTLWLVKSVYRDHSAALSHVDDAIAAVRGRADLAGMHLDLLDNRMFTLQNLDRLAEAGHALTTAREVAATYALPVGLQVSAAVHHYWTGQWDDALVELDTVTEDGPAITFYGLREPGAAMLLLHGVAALIAARRDEESQAAAHLDQAEGFAPATGSERDSFDFLLAANSIVAERRGDVDQALDALKPLLNPTYAQMLLRHQWLPRFVRLALSAGDRDLATAALRVCVGEAEREKQPARAFAAAEWAHGLLENDSARVLRAAAHYRKVRRRMELAEALEDAAVLLGTAGHTDRASTTLNEAVEIYADLSARWDISRAEDRLGSLGITRSVQAAAERPDTGWEALSPLEVRVATLVAAGYSNPHIAGQLALPRRNIQTHVASVLGKLDTQTRTGIADEVNRRAQDG